MNNELSAIEQGIKKIGVGKRTTKVCEPELVESIISDLTTDRLDPVQRATFLTALKVKGADGSEINIVDQLGRQFTDNTTFVNSIDNNLPEGFFNLLLKLLDKKYLTTDEAQQLGNYLFSKQVSSPAKAVAAVILRMRYTETDEYDGLLQALASTYNSSFSSTEKHSKLIQISEPFDGYKRGYLLAPIIAHFLQKKGYSTVLNAGHSSGPKYGVTPKTISKYLQFNELKSSSDINSSPKKYGHLLLQENLSEDLTHWQPIRKKMLKRPFLATLEKYVNPLNADLLICSSFHDTFYDKGLDIAKRAGFNKCINIIKGLEGGCGLSLKRKVKATMYVKINNKFEEFVFDFTPEDFNIEAINDQIIKDLDDQKNAELIEDYVNNDYQSSNEYFNLRAQYTIAVFDKLVTQAYSLGIN